MQCVVVGGAPPPSLPLRENYSSSGEVLHDGLYDSVVALVNLCSLEINDGSI